VARELAALVQALNHLIEAMAARVNPQRRELLGSGVADPVGGRSSRRRHGRYTGVSSNTPYGFGAGADYSGHSLEELRAIASSVDTGRITAMQLTFADVARQMNEAVSRLQQIRNDIPNYWQGAAADSLVSMFEPAVSHAHQATSMADGASKALRLCATMIGHQQEAMKQVPEVEDPNTLAPTTVAGVGDPFGERGGGG